MPRGPAGSSARLVRVAVWRVVVRGRGGGRVKRQANVRHWTPEILPLLTEHDPLGADHFATHHVPLSDAAAAYEMFQRKEGGAVKVVFRP